MSSLLIAADGHYYRDSKDRVYVESVFTSTFYSRYLDSFDEVYVLGRMEKVDNPPVGKKRADGPGIHFVDLLPGRGVEGLLKTGMANRRIVSSWVEKVDSVIARVPGVIANMTASVCEKKKIPYAVEVVVDPWEYFAKGVHGGPFRPLIRVMWTARLKKSCKCAIGASYVTERYLQQRYPCSALLGNPAGFTEHYSSVDLPDDCFSKPRIYGELNQITIAHAANSFSGNAKGHYTLFDVIATMRGDGYDARLLCIGDGPSIGDYRLYVKRLGIERYVTFTGRLPDGQAVREQMSSADLFVFPTKAEGLPRVLLEAMAEGLPCLSSPVCGIPEILETRYLFNPNDSGAFAECVEHLASSPAELSRMSEKNIAVAKRFARSVLQPKRSSFYQQVKQWKR